VIVGAGIAGVAAAESLRGAAPAAEITLLSQENELPYYRLNLTRYLAGQLDQRALPLHPASWYQERKIRLLLGAEAAAIDLKVHLVELRAGEKLPFDRLLLAAGAQPFVPPLPGTDLSGVTTLRTAEDARAILAACGAGRRCVCIGGGLLGLETAAALARHAADVTLLESHDWLLPRQTNRRAGEILDRYVAAAGITLRTKAATQAIVGDRRAEGVLLQQGEVIPAELIVIATGIRSDSRLAEQAGLQVHRGVVVNDLLATSHPDVFAAGDVAEHRGRVYGIWAPAQYQGNIAGLNMAGRGVEFGGLPHSNTLKVLGLDLFSIGPIEADAACQVLDEEREDRYFRFIFRDRRLVGAILLGDARLTAVVQKAVEGQEDFSALLARGPTAAEVAETLEERAGLAVGRGGKTEAAS
jgi:nitrite reductase (NADH) large subunit